MAQATRRKTSFRVMLGAVAALTTGPALAQSCLQPAEQTSFQVRGLQSQLMVAAITCGKENEYNAFVRKYQRDLHNAYLGIQSHYRRTLGAGPGQRELDNYITQLANAQSQDGIRAGSHFCSLATPLFSLAMQPADLNSLAAFAVERNLVNPVAANECPAGGAQPAARSNTRQAAAQRR
jgi:hypothetical protein